MVLTTALFDGKFGLFQTAKIWVAPQLTVVMDTTSRQDVALHVRVARAVWAVSTEAVAQETTVVLGRSNNER